MPRKPQADSSEYSVFSLSITKEQHTQLKAASAHLGMPMAVVCSRLIGKWLAGDIKLTNLPACPTAPKKP